MTFSLFGLMAIILIIAMAYLVRKNKFAMYSVIAVGVLGIVIVILLLNRALSTM
jgi:hypothetical protein